MRIAHVMGGSLEPGARGGVCDLCDTERPCVRLVSPASVGDTFICHVCEQRGLAEYLGAKAYEPCDYCEGESNENE